MGQSWGFCRHETESMGWSWIKPGASSAWNWLQVWVEHGPSNLGILLHETESLGWAWIVEPGACAAWNCMRVWAEHGSSNLGFYCMRVWVERGSSKLGILLHETDWEFGLSLDKTWGLCYMKLYESLVWAWVNPGASAGMKLRICDDHGSNLVLLLHETDCKSGLSMDHQTWGFCCMKLRVWVEHGLNLGHLWQEIIWQSGLSKYQAWGVWWMKLILGWVKIIPGMSDGWNWFWVE